MGWAYVTGDGYSRSGSAIGGTSELAEITALTRALQDHEGHPLIIHLDSEQLLHVCTVRKDELQANDYKSGRYPHAEQIQALHHILDGRPDPVWFLKVKGHSADRRRYPEHTQADILARRAARKTHSAHKAFNVA